MPNPYWNKQVGNINANKRLPSPPPATKPAPVEKVKFEEVNISLKVKEGL